MKNYFKQSHGFTLIELLIVIGILGVLAAAIVATLDPFEQIRKSRDSSLKDVSNEFLGASVRYYVANDAFPWASVAPNNCITGFSAATAYALSAPGVATCLTALITGGELKQGFTTSSNLSLIFFTNNTAASPSDLKVCFLPTSKKQQLDPQTKYTKSGGAGVTCKSAGGGSDCYWCTQ